MDIKPRRTLLSKVRNFKDGHFSIFGRNSKVNSQGKNGKLERSFNIVAASLRGSLQKVIYLVCGLGDGASIDSLIPNCS